MTRLALHLNDAGITLLDERNILYRQPGYALLEDEELTTGDAAFSQARINPRRIQHRYWSALSADPLPDRRFAHLTAADLASRQLEQMISSAGTGEAELIVAAPSYFDSAKLGLFLGIAAELGIPVIGLVDAAVAATRREYVDAAAVHVDMGLHATTLSRLSQSPQRVRLERAEVLEDCGLLALYDAWIDTIAEAFVQQSRFDPLHTAETEQRLLDSIAGWLTQAIRDESVELVLEYAGITHRAEIESLTLIGAAAPHYQAIVGKLRSIIRAGEVPALQLTDRVARLPGLSDMLKARIGGEVFALEPGATARGALARFRDLRAGEGGVSLLKQLPLDQARFVVETPESDQADGDAPTHMLYLDRAYPIESRPLVLGAGPEGVERALALGSDMPGVSRRHCTVARVNGQCVVEDHSRYGTFLNGHRISGSTVLQVGDTLRIGSPGYEFRMITTDTENGAKTA